MSKESREKIISSRKRLSCSSMKVILLKSVPKLGKANDILEVPDGYAANALFPKKLAIPATETAIIKVKQKEQNKVAQKEIQHNLLDRAIASLEGKSLVIKAKTNEKGSLFQKIDAKDVAKALLENHRITVDPKVIHIPDGAIKHTGTYLVQFVDGEYKVGLSVEIIG